MPEKSKLAAGAIEQTALRDLSKSEQRGEADRARAILLTQSGRRAGEIAAVLGVHISTVRNWRGYFTYGGVAGAIDRVFLDESAALTHPHLARCRARRGSDLRIEAPGQARRRAMLGAFDPVPRGSSLWAEGPRRLLVHTSATKRSTDFLALLDQLSAAYGTAERTRPLWWFSTTDRSTAAS
jgi:hypothetical protein